MARERWLAETVMGRGAGETLRMVTPLPGLPPVKRCHGGRRAWLSTGAVRNIPSRGVRGGLRHAEVGNRPLASPAVGMGRLRGWAGVLRARRGDDHRIATTVPGQTERRL
jgi:hypothetical protein